MTHWKEAGSRSNPSHSHGHRLEIAIKEFWGFEATLYTVKLQVSTYVYKMDINFFQKVIVNKDQISSS